MGKLKCFRLDFGISGEPEDGLPKNILIRNLVAFWLLGLCNNFAYCIMLSAANDILRDLGINDGSNQTTGFNPDRDCNAMSAGAILLADVLPSLFIKVLAPFFISYTFLQISGAIVLALACFIMVAFAKVSWLTYTGVAFASLSSGLGETTLLRYSTYYTKNVISTWASGTGMSGVLGSFLYASITTRLSPRNTLLVMIVVPVLMAVTFFLILVHPKKMEKLREKARANHHRNSESICAIESTNEIDECEVKSETSEKEVLPLTFINMLRLIVPLLKYMIPLALVYFAEYFINQGLSEIIFFQDISLSHAEQYRWYQVLYQVGVFISRSSVNFFQISWLWILPVLQWINLTIFMFEAYYLYMPSIWIAFVLILYEGLLGGAAYVNTFYKVTQVVEGPYREFSMGAASMGDSFGITLAALLSIPVHNAMCKAPIPTLNL